MKMHEKLSARQLEPRNTVKCKFHLSYNEESGEPVQLWFTNTLKRQGVFMERSAAYELRNALTKILEE